MSGHDHSGEKQAVAFNSILASAGLTILKFAAAFWTGSLGVLSEAIHSLLDVGATLMTYFAVRVSDRPADDQHHYGHTKVESVAALAETGLLYVTSAWIIYEAVSRLITGHNDVDAHPAAIVIMLISIGVDFTRARILTRTAKATNSQALEADALHFSSDMWSSMVVLAGLGLVWLGWKTADAFAAIVVSGFVAHAAWELGRRTLDTLLDTAPEGAADKLRAAAERVSGVAAIERLRIRPAGSVHFAELEVAVSRTRPFDEITRIKKALTDALTAAMPEVEASVIAHPRALDDETIHDRVMIIARNMAVAVHHVTVQQVGEDHLAIALDIEVDGRLPLVDAHRIATDLENAIAAEMGRRVEVETHIEPLITDSLDGADLPEADRGEIVAILQAAAEAAADVRDVHNVRARRTDEGLFVNFHCKIRPDMSVYDAHVAIDDLERALRRARPDLRRAIGHAEPHGVSHPERAPELQIRS